MTKSLTFKQYLTKMMTETSIETIWGKKLVNVASEEEEAADTPETDDIDIELDDSEESDDLDLDMEFDDVEDDTEEPEDPDRQGVIRTVKGAHLVYKRQDEEGTYEELWMYKIGGAVKDELDIRRDVLAGTDIPQGKTKSEDKTQEYELWTSGNVQFLHLTGLPN